MKIIYIYIIGDITQTLHLHVRHGASQVFVLVNVKFFRRSLGSVAHPSFKFRMGKFLFARCVAIECRNQCVLTLVFPVVPSISSLNFVANFLM